MARSIVAGIDVGTGTIRAVLSEYKKGESSPTILATSAVASSGLRDGYVVETESAGDAIKRAIRELEHASGLSIKRVGISVGGASLGAHTVTGSVVMTRADQEVTMLDIAKAMKEARASVGNPNERIIHTIPREFRLDGKEVLGDPIGLVGTKLEVKALVVYVQTLHLERLIAAIGGLGIEISSIVASPLAASLLCLSQKQKVAGCALVNIGAETVTTGIFENGALMSIFSIPLGSVDITNDIALGLKIPLDEAEGVKTGALISSHPKRKLDEIVGARLTDIFELLNKHLKKIGRQALLPAGTILIGGGARLHECATIAKEELKLPVMGGSLLPAYEAGIRTKDPVWFVALGICIYERREPGTTTGERDRSTKPIGAKEGFFSFIKQFLPIFFFLVSAMMWGA